MRTTCSSPASGELSGTSSCLCPLGKHPVPNRMLYKNGSFYFNSCASIQSPTVPILNSIMGSFYRPTSPKNNNTCREAVIKHIRTRYKLQCCYGNPCLCSLANSSSQAATTAKMLQRYSSQNTQDEGFLNALTRKRSKRQKNLSLWKCILAFCTDNKIDQQ